MRWMAVLMLQLGLAAGLFAGDAVQTPDKPKSGETKQQEQSKLTYPADLKPPSPLIVVLHPSDFPTKQEYVEVNADQYPGLALELPALKQRIRFAAKPIPKPAHDTRYYRNGGLVLNFLGIPLRASGELVSTGVPTPAP